MTINVTSPVFEPNGPIPRMYTGDGEDVSPPIHIDGPPDAQEYALIMDDPDAPTPEPWVHWVIYKLPSDTRIIPEGVEQDERPRNCQLALQGPNSWDTIGYRGPAPPRGHGVHHYHFHVYALREPVDVRGPITKEDLLRAMQGLILDEGDLIGTYERKK